MLDVVTPAVRAAGRSALAGKLLALVSARMQNSRFAIVLALAVTAACATDSSSPSADTTAIVETDAGTRVSVAPTLKAGVDPAIFLPTTISGYHPTAEELATSGKACFDDGDCATSGGQIVFHCSVPYYGQAQCQGTSPGDQLVPGVKPSCVYYDCPADFECSSEAETASVTCLQHQSHHGGR